MKKVRFFLLCIVCIQCIELCAQNRLQYEIKIKNTNAAVITPNIKTGTSVRANGESLGYTGNYLLCKGKPWFPIMGEFHFNRYKPEQWEQEICAMKASGINVISTYLFWIFIEPKEGFFDWSGNNDLKRFLGLCQKHGMYAWLRIGPWAHAELRYGAFPDWLMEKNIKRRTNDPGYLHYTDLYFKQVAKQCEGFYFKQGGPIIGVQLENEYEFKKTPEYEHMKTLKKQAIENGIDVPFYSAFAPGPDNQDEFFYTIGSYADSPWNMKTTTFYKPVFFIRPLKADDDMGSNLFGKVDATVRLNYPLLSAELGGGVPSDYNRRVDLSTTDVVSNIFVKLAAGINGLGYYMYHGGMNPVDWANNYGFEESRGKTLPGNLPLINYDFQAPIGAMGIPAPHFYELKLINLFAQAYGDKLAETRPYFPGQLKKSMFSTDTVQSSVRTKNGAGFIFLSNYQRFVPMPAVENFQLSLNDGTTVETVPAKPITFPSNYYAIWPYKLDMQSVLLKYATVQPLSIVNTGGTKTFVFFRDSIVPEMVFDNTTIKKISALKGCIWNEKTSTITSDKQEGDFYFEVANKDGEQIKVLVITRDQALQAYKISYDKNKEALMLTHALLRQEANDQWSLEAASKDGKIEVKTYPSTAVLVKSLSNAATCKQMDAGNFSSFVINTSVVNKPSVMYSLETDKDIKGAKAYKDSLLTVFKKSKDYDSLKPGIVYLPEFHSLPEQQLYRSNYSCKPSDGVIDWEVTLHYDGSMLAMYQYKKLVFDQVNYNGICKYRLNYVSKNTTDPILVQLIPAIKKENIYWGSLEKTLDDQLNAKIKEMEIVPVYRYKVSIETKPIK